jgi:HlyD family secretion protein
MANTRKINRKRTLIGAAVFTVVILGWSYYSRTSRAAVSGGGESTYPAARQDMTISVLESGSIKAKNSITIRSEVEGRTTIVDIVPEGTILTQADVDAGKVILALDTSTMKEDLNRQQIAFNTAKADFTDARENLDIQKNQNESNIQQGKLTVKFGLMDLEKYMGQSAADILVADANDRPATDEDFKKLTRDPNQLGGESLQTYRQLTSDISMAQSEYYLAQNTLTWTEKLAAKDYVAKTELESDKLKADKSKITHEQAQTALGLFVQYEFPKEAHKLFSDYVEAKRQLERTLAKARSQEAQAEAKLSSAEATFSLEKERLEKLLRQIAASVIKAPCPGMVVYSSQRDSHGGTRSRTSIEVGREVMEREEIMSIPSALDVLVDTKVHETNIDKVTIGQKAKITVDAMPDTVFSGEVLKIAPLPDPGSFMSNPDLKLYATDVALDGGQMLRPGMSAKVEIIIAQLKDVLTVPIQCVSNRAGKKICYVQTSSRSEPREIKVGAYNDKFVQILEGIKDGEKVLLNPPRVYDQPQQGAAAKSAGNNQPGEQRPGGPRGQGRPDGQITGDQPQSDGQPPANRRRPAGQQSDGQFSPDGQQPNGQADSPRPRRQRPSGQSPADGQQPTGQTDSQRPQRQRPGGGDPGNDTSARETQ